MYSLQVLCAEHTEGEVLVAIQMQAERVETQVPRQVATRSETLNVVERA